VDRYDPRDDDAIVVSAWDRSLVAVAAPAIATEMRSAIDVTCSRGISTSSRARSRASARP